MTPIYYARLDEAGIVQQVQVTTREFVEANPDRYPGHWEETCDPYSEEPQEVTYCGIGMGFSPNLPQKFAAPWEPPAPEPEPQLEQAAGARTFTMQATAAVVGYSAGEVRWHKGRLWRSLVDGNTTEPGMDASWTDQPPGDGR